MIENRVIRRLHWVGQAVVFVVFAAALAMSSGPDGVQTATTTEPGLVVPYESSDGPYTESYVRMWVDTFQAERRAEWYAAAQANERAKRRATTTQTPAVSGRTAVPKSQPDQQFQAAGNGSVWDRLAQCESGGNWAANTGNGYYGGLQFSLSSWQAVGGTGYPHQASRDTQIAMGERLRSQGGWGHWPTCSRKIGLR